MNDPQRLDFLIDRYLDNCLEPLEKEELEILLLASSDARQQFLMRTEQHGLLREWAIRSNSGNLLETAGRQVEKSKVVKFHFTKWAKRLGPAVAGLAAALALGIWLGQEHKKPELVLNEAASQTSNKEKEVAFLADAVGALWEGMSPAIGTSLTPGSLRLTKGIVRLDYYSGASVYLEGPAEIELISPDLARLIKGKITAHVPPAAKGFTVLNRETRVVDLGTEFGMSTENDGRCEVHVFDGKVELYQPTVHNAPTPLVQGQGMSIVDGKTQPLDASRQAFASLAGFGQLAMNASAHQLAEWRAASHRKTASNGILAYFDFETAARESSEIGNRAQLSQPSSQGAVIGCEWLTGRWENKQALSFARTSDRVRFNLDGSTTTSLTLVTSVRVDGLAHDHNALLSMAPGQVGELHWKLDRQGRLLVGLRAEAPLDFKSWERLASESPVIADSQLGQWVILATVIDGNAKKMTHYVNGQAVAAGPLNRVVPIILGKATLGNFDPSTSHFPEQGSFRSFHGRMDEFALFRRALSAAEIWEEFK